MAVKGKAGYVLGESVVHGTIYKIDRFATHDGKGIRTLIFLKGCPLKCIWCSSPESQKPTPELLFIEEKCINCLQCVDSCIHGAISINNGKMEFDRALCQNCGKCAVNCPTGARSMLGQYYAVEEVIEIIERDSVLHNRSGGGVTVSGGEPLAQVEFTLELLQESKRRNINTAMETSGYGEWNSFEEILHYVDQLFFDLKGIDPVKHEKNTGYPNDIILHNLERVVQMVPKIKFELTIRLPIVPGYNDSYEEVSTEAKFLHNLNVLLTVELLPYHRYGISKYRHLGRIKEIKEIALPTENHLRKLQKILESYSIPCSISN